MTQSQRKKEYQPNKTQQIPKLTFFIILCKTKIKIQFNDFQFTLILLLQQSTTSKF